MSKPFTLFFHSEQDAFTFPLSPHKTPSWEDEEIVNLLSREENQRHLCCGELPLARNEAIHWMLKQIARNGFTTMTAVLSVNYFDRFIASRCFQKEKPWMSQLAAVACLSIAAKMEETRVPPLLDLQDEESKYVFEAKTIQRMELLVLSTLRWKMNPVTPLCFLDHIVRRFQLMDNPHWVFLKRCESITITILADSRITNYLPSVIAAATMTHVIQEIEPSEAWEWENRFISALKISKEKIYDCHKCIAEIIDDQAHRMLGQKRKHDAMPGSPSGVIDAYYNSDANSNESWSVASSPEPCLKRSRANGASA